MPRLAILAILPLAGCWNDPITVDLGAVRFVHEGARVTTGVIETDAWDLDCPDGQQARFYVLHDTTWTEPVPVAILLHGSAFDYVIDPAEDDPLDGPHYAAGNGSVTRLHRAWGVGKAWEALGMVPQLDPAEVHTGALPAALLDAGVAVVLPINCWGDLWHNETGRQDNDLEADLFARNGRVLPVRLARALADPDYAAGLGIEFPMEPAPGELLYVGLGDGGRGVIELLLDPDAPAPRAVLVDSFIEDLSPWADDPLFDREQEGLARIYHYTPGVDEPDWSAWTLQHLVEQGALDDARLAIVTSSGDPEIPYARTHYDGLVAAVDARGLDALVDDSDEVVHVRSNRDDLLARSLVDFLLQGD